MVRIQRYPQGTRVRVQRGSLPTTAELLGRTGTVVYHDPRSAARYGVQLDGESQIRIFREDELTAEIR